MLVSAHILYNFTTRFCVIIDISSLQFFIFFISTVTLGADENTKMLNQIEKFVAKIMFILKIYFNNN